MNHRLNFEISYQDVDKLSFEKLDSFAKESVDTHVKIGVKINWFAADENR